MDEQRQEHVCLAAKMSLQEMQLMSRDVPALGEKLIIYLEELGRFSGKVDRLETMGFALTIDLTSKKRDALADRLMWFANRHLPEISSERQHARIVPFKQRALISNGQGVEYLVNILDVSASGAAIKTNHIFEVGAEITIGKTPARVVRRFDGGFGCAFLYPFDPSQVDESIKL